LIKVYQNGASMFGKFMRTISEELRNSRRRKEAEEEKG
jgi:hypothetical protein